MFYIPWYYKVYSMITYFIHANTFSDIFNIIVFIYFPLLLHKKIGLICLLYKSELWFM